MHSTAHAYDLGADDGPSGGYVLVQATGDVPSLIETLGAIPGVSEVEVVAGPFDVVVHVPSGTCAEAIAAIVAGYPGVLRALPSVARPRRRTSAFGPRLRLAPPAASLGA